MSIHPNPLLEACSFDDLARLNEQNMDALRRIVRTDPDPAAIVKEIPAGTDPGMLFRVARTQTVRWRGQTIQLRRDQEVRVGRYGAAVISGWIKDFDLRLVAVAVWAPEEVQVEADIPAPPPASVEAPAPKKARKAKGK